MIYQRISRDLDNPELEATFRNFDSLDKLLKTFQPFQHEQITDALNQHEFWQNAFDRVEIIYVKE